VVGFFGPDGLEQAVALDAADGVSYGYLADLCLALERQTETPRPGRRQRGGPMSDGSLMTNDEKGDDPRRSQVSEWRERTIQVVKVNE
jgi:hypothetical protein